MVLHCYFWHPWRNIFLTTRDPELVKKIGAATALEVRATGIPYVFAPCIAVAFIYLFLFFLFPFFIFGDVWTSYNGIFKQFERVIFAKPRDSSHFWFLVLILFEQVCRDPRWGRCYESYSEDPQIVQAMTEIIPGLQGDIPATSPMGVPFVAGK